MSAIEVQERFGSGMLGGVYRTCKLNGGHQGYSKYREYDTGHVLEKDDIFDFTDKDRIRWFKCVVGKVTQHYVTFASYYGGYWDTKKMHKNSLKEITFNFTEDSRLSTRQQELLEGCIAVPSCVPSCVGLPMIDDAYYGEYDKRFPKQKELIMQCMQRNIPKNKIITLFQSFIEEATDASTDGDVIKWCDELKKLFKLNRL